MYLLECYDKLGELHVWELGENLEDLKHKANTMSEVAGYQAEVWSVYCDEYPIKQELELIIPVEY